MVPVLRRAVLALSALAAPAAAQDFPARPVRIVVPFPPGGPTDIIARLLLPEIGLAVRHGAVIENRGGGGGNIGTEAVARAAPDGHTILITASTHAINPGVLPSIPYDPVRDFAPITLLASGPFVLVVPSSMPVHSLADLLALARREPGRLNYASASNGSGNHLAMEMLKQATGTDMVHVPFAGAAPATTALLGGQVQAMFNNMLSAVPHLREGRLRALAVSGLSRSPVLPDVPAVAETIPGFDATTWYGALAPAGTPAPVVERLRAVLAGAVRGSAVKEQLLAQGVEAAPSTPAEFTRFIEAELRKWRDAARAAGVRVD